MYTPRTAGQSTLPDEGDARSEDHPTGRSQTVASAKGESSPRLPHERDESSDSGARPPDEIMKKAHDDVEDGKVATDKSEVTDVVYADLRKPS